MYRFSGAIRLWLARPSSYWMVAAAAALLAGLVVVGAARAGKHQLDRFGELAPVAVAAADLDVGRVLTESDVVIEQRPVAHIPGSAVPAPQGRVVADPLATDEIILEHHLEGAATPGQLLVALESAAPLPAVGPGDRVDVFSAAPDGEPPRLVADGLEVKAVTDTTITAAVNPETAPELLAPLMAGTLVVMARTR